MNRKLVQFCLLAFLLMSSVVIAQELEPERNEVIEEKTTTTTATSEEGVQSDSSKCCESIRVEYDRRLTEIVAEFRKENQRQNQQIKELTHQLNALKASPKALSTSGASDDEISKLRTSIDGVKNDLGKQIQHYVSQFNRQLYLTNFYNPVVRTHIPSFKLDGSIEQRGIPSVVPAQANQVFLEINFCTVGKSGKHGWLRDASMWTQHNDGRQFRVFMDAIRVNTAQYCNTKYVWLPIAETNRVLYGHCSNVQDDLGNFHFVANVLGWK